MPMTAAVNDVHSSLGSSQSRPPPTPIRARRMGCCILNPRADARFILLLWSGFFLKKLAIAMGVLQLTPAILS